MFSTRGRYALRFLVDLAENQGDGFITMKDIATRQEISQKYAERLLSILSDNKIVEARHGKGGGYRLSRRPDEYKVSDILRVMDEELAPVACLSCGGSGCHRADGCRTLPMWKELDGIINNFFDNITIADLVQDKTKI